MSKIHCKTHFWTFGNVFVMDMPPPLEYVTIRCLRSSGHERAQSIWRTREGDCTWKRQDLQTITSFFVQS